jgi:group I intron endonuclease
MMKNFNINKLTVVLSVGDNERVLRGSGALGLFRFTGSFSTGVFRGSFSNYNLFSSCSTLYSKETKDMLYKKGLPAIYLNMKDNKQAILDENNDKAGIYLITNKINKKHYVGKSSNLRNRFYNYFSEGFLLRNNDTKIYNIIRKLGHNNFSLSILEYCSSPAGGSEADLSLLSSREQYFIDIFKPLYNSRKSVVKDNMPKGSSNTNKISKQIDDQEIFTLFKKKFNNQVIPQKVSDLIQLAETSDYKDFLMQIEMGKNKNYFIFHFIDYKNKILHHANSAL